ncbi:hypothetical protein WH47_06341 [Habropoda laboriosa]|uniref:TGF-beta propeptide domain-containing protein n=1 Tax=Habropoda laboriosa TaxID=597456 RepID=A0A0L7RCL7_9HYME|nr:PREDICTED: uncharacterized protein LOC108579714 [Habropoda laboriosa]KOC68550.1 hypothetical protein WH47_06341 [Habropoda laboriosa]
MGFFGVFVWLMVASTMNGVSCHHHRRGVHVEDRNNKGDLVEHVKRYTARNEENVVSSEGEKNKRDFNDEETKIAIPFSERRLEKMLEKAILKIITGELSTGDMLLLKSLNYSLEEVLAIRERELSKKKEEESRKKESMKPRAKTLYGDEKKNRHWDKNSMDRTSSRNPDFEDVDKPGKKNRHVDSSLYKDFDFEAYNKQAILDYENLSSNLEFQQSWSEPTAADYEETTKASKEEDIGQNLHRDFDRAMEPHVVFKIRYDDSEFDSSSGSDENSKNHLRTSKHRASSSVRHTTSRSAGNSFHASTPSTIPSTTAATLPLVYRLTSPNSKDNDLNNDYSTTTASSTSSTTSTTSSSVLEEVFRDENKTSIVGNTDNSTNEAEVSKSDEKPRGSKKISEYEGLEWVEDDVYRVIPEFANSLGFENTEDNETSDYEDSSRDSRLNWTMEENENDTSEYQNDTPDSVKLFTANNNTSASNLPLANLSTYLQVAIAHRRGGNLTSSFDSQGEKAIEDIKSRVLALTGRFNLSANTNQVQRERLTMFSPTCQIPRNTDQDAWADPFSMNMHFQLNLTSGDHVIAAKLRIFKLPQENVTSSSEGTFDEEEEDEKKIRISVFYYTKSLKRHRSKKRLMDSVVTPLTSKGTHLALDVRQGLRFWRLNPRNSHGNGSNHGLVIQVEDQDGKPLKPALYIQQPSCADQDSDQKAYQRVPALFVRACTRYVRIVNGKTETYVNCRH